MLRQQKRNQLLLVGAVLLCLLVEICLFARKRAAKPDSSAPITQHAVENSPDDALKYWTEEKKQEAKGAELPHVATPGRKKRQTRRPPA